MAATANEEELRHETPAPLRSHRRRGRKCRRTVWGGGRRLWVRRNKGDRPGSEREVPMLQRTSDLLKTSIAEFKKVPPLTNGNGHVHERTHANGGNGHQVRRRVKSHMKNGGNQAACRALGAVLLILRCGLT